MSKKKESKGIILCKDIKQRNKNIDAFAKKFIREHKGLMDRLSK